MTKQEITNRAAADRTEWRNAHSPGAGAHEPYLHMHSSSSRVFVGEYWEHFDLSQWHMTERGIRLEGFHPDPGMLDVHDGTRPRADRLSRDLIEAVEPLDYIGGFYVVGDAR